MILLDTNVLSALMHRAPEPAVVDWLDAQPPESIWTTTITVFEIRFGLELLDPGRRRRGLESAFDAVLAEELDGRIALFDRPAAESAARLAAQGRRAGRPGEIRDLQIAGITASRKATLATRNLRHFEALGISLIDPWEP
jgi:predicted nucleic acid-binding protein